MVMLVCCVEGGISVETLCIIINVYLNIKNIISTWENIPITVPGAPNGTE